MIIYKLRFYKISKLPYESMKVGWLKILQSGINMKLFSLSPFRCIFENIQNFKRNKFYINILFREKLYFEECIEIDSIELTISLV